MGLFTRLIIVDSPYLDHSTATMIGKSSHKTMVGKVASPLCQQWRGVAGSPLHRERNLRDHILGRFHIEPTEK